MHKGARQAGSPQSLAASEEKWLPPDRPERWRKESGGICGLVRVRILRQPKIVALAVLGISPHPAPEPKFRFGTEGRTDLALPSRLLLPTVADVRRVQCSIAQRQVSEIVGTADALAVCGTNEKAVPAVRPAGNQISPRSTAGW